MDAEIDVVVVSYNNRETLRACVEPLVGIDGITVTVVDNASADDSLAAVADLPLRQLRSGRNGGFAFGSNLGMTAGHAPFVLFLNPDARIERHDLQRLVDVLESEPEVGIVGPHLVEDSGKLYPSLRRYQRAGCGVRPPRGVRMDRALPAAVRPPPVAEGGGEVQAVRHHRTCVPRPRSTRRARASPR